MHLTTRSQFPLRKWVVSIAAASCDRLVAEAVLGGVCGQLDATEHAELAQEHGISLSKAREELSTDFQKYEVEGKDIHEFCLAQSMDEIRGT